MKKIILITVAFVLMVLSHSCGIDGDPGHCYFSLDWEYYNDDYGVNYYEDNNPDVPEAKYIEQNLYYDCYPGIYDFYYESVYYDIMYTYEGTYTLLQNPGSPARLFADGMDGQDTHFDLYLLVRARKNLDYDLKSGSVKPLESSRGERIQKNPFEVEEFNWSESKDGWTMSVSMLKSSYKK